MPDNVPLLLATFTAPENIGMNPQSMLWMLPLAAAIAVVYKAIKLPAIRPGSFIRESCLLFASIVAFIIAAAAVLWLVTYLAIG